MAAACFTRVTFQGAVLDRLIWHCQPFSVHQHLYSVGSSSVMGRTAVALVAAALPEAVFEGHVDVVGVSWG